MSDEVHRLRFPNVQKSFLRVSDSSIIAWNSPTPFKQETEKGNVEEAAADEKICVYLRIKKSPDQHLYEVKDRTELICTLPKGCFGSRNTRDGQVITKSYKFSHIFQSNVTQEEIFHAVVKPKLLNFLNGCNSTILTYGASGSGKTYTVIGTDSAPGLVPRSLEYLFRTLPKLSSNPGAKPLPNDGVIKLNSKEWRRENTLRNDLISKCFSSLERNHHVKIYMAMQERLSSEHVAQIDNETQSCSLSIWISFAEIYNEQIYDLLQAEPLSINKQRTRLALGLNCNNTYIKNLSVIPVSSGLEAYQLMQYGLAKLKYAATNINDHSSRSHSIFTIKFLQVSAEGVKISKFNFCDLAGSERTKKTMNVGERLKESNNINGSLMILGRCIKAIRDTQRIHDNRLVPFRESKLTQLFQNALSGHEDVSMIVTISPSEEMFDESMHVLNFSAIAKDIKIEHPPISPMNRNKLVAELHKSRRLDNNENAEEIEELQERIYQLEDNIVQNCNLIEMERREADYLNESYQHLVDRMSSNLGQMMRYAEQDVDLRYELKFDALKRDYEERLENIVIELSDSEDEKTAEKVVKPNYTQLREKHESALKRLKSLTMECEDLEKMYQLKESESLKLMEKCEELEMTLAGYGDQFTVLCENAHQSALEELNGYDNDQ